MTALHRNPAAYAMGLALALLAGAVSAEEARPATTAAATGATCPHQMHSGPRQSTDMTTRMHAEPAAPMPGGNGKGEPQPGPSGGPPTAGGAPPPAAAGAAPHAHITVSGSNFAAACATGTLPAEAPAAQATKATKTRSNIQNN